MELAELTSNPKDEVIGKIGCKLDNCRIYSMMNETGSFWKSDCPNFKTCLRSVDEKSEPYSFCYIRMREYVESPPASETFLH